MTERERRRDEYIRLIESATDFPSFSKQMADLMACLDDAEASAQRLANLVLRDYSLTLKVIRAANTVFYNRTGRPVTSATQAIMLLGVRTVRDLALGLLLFEQYQRRSPELKQLLLLSLLSALHARGAAVRIGLEEPETAHLCGMFRNLGEVLVACHLPAEYVEIRAIIDRDGGRIGDATLAVLGCSYEEVAGVIAQRWGMPAGMRRAMKATGGTNEDALALATAFGHELTAMLYRSSDVSDDALTALLTKFGARLRMNHETVARVVHDAVTETRGVLGDALGDRADDALARQMTAALHRVGVGGEAGTTMSAASEPAPRAMDELRHQLALEVQAAVPAESGVDMHRVALMALEAAFRGGPFDRTVFCLLDSTRTEFSARFGLGDGVERAVASFRIPAASHRIGVGQSLLLGREVVLFGGGLAPDEQHLLRIFGAAAAVLLPLVIEGTTVGCLYCDLRAVPQRKGDEFPGRATLGYLRYLRDAMARAIAGRRQAGAPGTTPAAGAATVREEPSSSGLSNTGVTAAAASSAATEWTPEAKGDIVLRMLRGEMLVGISQETGVAIEELDRWKSDFLAGAVEGLRTRR